MPSPALFDFTDKPNQRAFFYDPSRNVAYFGGYGNGKTYAACGKAWLLGESIPGNVILIGRKTYPALKSSTMETFLTIAKARNGGSLDPGPIIESYNKSENVMTLRNGSKFFFRTLDDEEKLRSLNLGAAMVDQAEEIAYEIYLELNGRIRFWTPYKVRMWQEEHGLRLKQTYGFVPTPYNQLICVGNPKPNWCKREFKEGKKTRLYEASTHENIRFLPADYVEQLESRYPKEWVDRFVKGSWDTFGGQIYKDFEYDGVHRIGPMQIPPEWPVFVGWDHGITNPTACMVGVVDEDGNIILVDEYYRSGLTVDQYAAEAKAMLSKWNVPRSNSGDLLVHMDPSAKANKGTGEIDVWEAYRRHGIFGLDANNSVMDGILWMQYLLRPDPNHVFPKWHIFAGKPGSPRLFYMGRGAHQKDGGLPNFVNEMALYEWQDADVENEWNRVEAPRKWQDHSLDAVRYLAMAVKSKHAPKTFAPGVVEQVQREKERSRHLEHIFTPDSEG